MSNTAAIPAPGQTGTVPSTFDAVVVGAGFAGLYMLHRLRTMGLSVRVFEQASGIGGTWFWNRYPGARCDMESLAYSYSFSEELQQEWRWSERYPSQPELLRYLNHVADRFQLRPDIQLETQVMSAVFDETTDRWRIRTDRGDDVLARYCVMATGCLSKPHVPDIKGLDSFEGQTYLTAQWPRRGVDFTGHTVGVIGTGSSGIQVIPRIAEQAAHLYVFQRTANFCVPAWNGPLDPDVEREVKANYQQLRQQARESLFGLAFEPTENAGKSALEVSPEERHQEYEAHWQNGGLSIYAAFADMMVNGDANETAAEFVRAKIRETVHDPAVAELLTPTGFPLGSKRLGVETEYYRTFNRANVTLVDVRNSPIEEITAHGLRTGDRTYELDSIVLATGFDAITGPLTAIDLIGRDGVQLRDKWADGPRTYLGMATAGFPNLFFITGPGSPSVIGNVVVSIEQHVEWIADCINRLQQAGVRRIEATPEAEQEWVSHVDLVANYTLFPRADSWYTGANIDGKARGFMPYLGGVGPYRQKCDELAANSYEGFTTDRPLA